MQSGNCRRRPFDTLGEARSERAFKGAEEAEIASSQAQKLSSWDPVDAVCQGTLHFGLTSSLLAKRTSNDG